MSRKWLYDKGLLNKEPTKKWEEKMIVLTKDANYFIDEEGIFWENFMCFPYPEEIKWTGNYEPKTGTVAKVMYGFIEDVLFCLSMDGRPFAVNTDSIREIDPDDMDQDGIYEGCIIHDNIIFKGEFKTSYGMPVVEGGFGVKVETPEKKKLSIGYSDVAIGALLNMKEQGTYQYKEYTLLFAVNMIQIISGDTPIFVFNTDSKEIAYIDGGADERDIVNTILDYYGAECLRVKGGKIV